MVVIMKQIIVNNISTSYFITENGQCYNSITKKYLKGQVGKKNGYLSFNLTLPQGQKKRVYAHRLVALHFIPNENKNKKDVNHKDGNKLNNCVDNLEWVTPSENQQHAIALKPRKFDHVFCFNKEKKLVAEYLTVPQAAAAVGISESIIRQELNKEEKCLSGGFYWSRKKELGLIKQYLSTGKAKEVYQYTLGGKFVNSYESTGAAARSLGIKSSSHIGECCRGKIKSYKGFIWRYAEDIVLPFVKAKEDVSNT